MGHTIATSVFWLSAFAVVYAYLLYPVVLFVAYSLSQLKRDWAYLTGRKNRRPRALGDDELAPVTIIIPAHNEEAHLAATLASLDAIDYPARLTQIIIASDGSTDGTNEILRKVQDPRIETLFCEEQRGKASVLNAAVARAKHDIIVFCDASTQLSRGAVRSLVRHFSNPTTGVVCGSLDFIRSAESRETEGHYWRYEAMLRLMESRLGATLTASGAIYAIRRECYQPLEADALVDDLLVPMRARRKGFEVVYDPEATATEFAASVVAGEARRRTRLATGSFRALPELLRTPMPGFTFFAFLSHKLMRWMVPFFLIGLLVSNVFLADGFWYRMILIAQLAFYAWACLGLLFRTQLQRVPYGLVGYFLIAMNVAFLKGFVKALRNHGHGTWERVG